MLDRKPGRGGELPERYTLKPGQNVSTEDFGIGLFVVPVPGPSLAHPPGVGPPHLPLGLGALTRIKSLSPEPCQSGSPRRRERGSLSPLFLRQAFVTVGSAGRVQDQPAGSAGGR